MTTGSFKHALNDGEVEVFFEYPWPHADAAELTKVMFKNVDISQAMHPEDVDYLNGLLYEKALEHKEEERMCAAEAAWERDRDDKMMRELT